MYIPNLIPRDSTFEIHSSPTGFYDFTPKDIVYLTIAGALVLMTLSEMALFTLSYTYAFIHVHRTSSRIPERILSLVMLILLYLTRTGLLFMMISVLPLPGFVSFTFPHAFIMTSQYFGVFLVGVMLVLPALTSIWQIATSRDQRQVKEETIIKRGTSSCPKVVIVMPVYNEKPDVLFDAICSVVDGDYPKEHLHLFISFDDENESELYKKIVSMLGIPSFEEGFEYPPLLEFWFRGVQISISRFPHGGKRLTQKKTFALIHAIYSTYSEKDSKLFVLFIDSDIMLNKSTILNFMWDMELDPKSPRNYLGMTGVIAITSSGEDKGFMSVMQDMEYVHGQLFGRAIESAAGSVICMPGALTIFRYSDFVHVSDEYFAEREADNLFDYGRSHLGEDRYLTHLLMLRAPTSHRIQFCHRAVCKTEAVFTMKNLLKQRRRWFMGFITNESALLSDDRLWRNYPFLLTFCLLRNVVNNSALFGYVVVIGVIFGYGSWTWLWLLLVLFTFGVNYFLMMTYGLRLGRYKTFLYPVLFFIAPIVSWYIFVYSVLTANERTWGGPRIDSTKKPEDEKPVLDEKKMEDEEASDGEDSEADDCISETGGRRHKTATMADYKKHASLDTPINSIYSRRSFALSTKWWDSQEDLNKLGVYDYEQRQSMHIPNWNNSSDTLIISRTMPQSSTPPGTLSPRGSPFIGPRPSLQMSHASSTSKISVLLTSPTSEPSEQDLEDLRLPQPAFLHNR